MADSASESHFQSDTLGPRGQSSSFFNLPGFFAGFGPKCSLEADSLRSPTSPLDFSFLSNLGNPFSLRSSKLLSRTGYQKKWNCSKVGLGIIDLLADEWKPTGQVLESPSRKNIIFGPQVKRGDSPRSNSWPRNYVISHLSPDNAPCTLLGKSVSVCGKLEDKPFEISSLIGLTLKPDVSQKKFGPKDRTATITIPPVLIDGDLQKETSLVTKPSSLPVPIGSNQGCVGSLSAQEIELSEDYTCVISHGPNPKTTHIFGDYILECHPNELSNFDKTEDMESELPQVAKRPECSVPNLSDEFLSFCYSCKRKLEARDDIFMYRGEKAFCSFDCRSSEIFAEEEMDKTDEDNKSFHKSSYDDDLFLMGMPIAT